MLNYGYVILASEVTKTILLAGLDSYYGVLHYDIALASKTTIVLI